VNVSVTSVPSDDGVHGVDLYPHATSRPKTTKQADVTSSPVVSIVIIFLNAEKFLTDAIDSVLAQTFDKWELFLVDDGSTDRSTAIARSYVERFPNKIQYLEHEGHANKGMSASRNLGIAHATGEFVALLDADDIWFPDKLHTQVAILTTHPEAAMVAAPAMNWYSDGAKEIQPMTLSEGIMPPGAWIPKILEKDDNTAGPSSVLIRTRVLREVGGFEASFKGPLMVFEDQVTWFKVTLAAPVYFYPKPVIFYRIHADSCCVSTPTELQLSGRIVLYARLADFIRTTTGPAPKRGLLLSMARARVGELLLKTEPRHRETAKSLDSSGSVDRLRLGIVSSSVLMLGRLSKGKAITLFQKIFGLLSVAYHDGPLSSARTLPRLVVSATRSVVPRSLQG
jgi:GT2 family glycosyltransferase